MTAAHKHDGFAAGEHIIATDRTIRRQRVFDAFVVSAVRAHADIACLAVKSIDSQSFADPADPALGAMIDVFVFLVVMKLANVAVIAGERTSVALFARASLLYRLHFFAGHTQHELCGVSVDVMVGVLVVAETAHKELATTIGLYLAPSLVVLATQHPLRVVRDLEFVFGHRFRLQRVLRSLPTARHQFLHSLRFGGRIEGLIFLYFQYPPS